METLWILGLCKAVALPAICAVLKCIAKQKGHSLPRWGQLLRGVFLSQIIVLTVVGTLHVYEPAFWILVAAAGSWFATIWILDQCSFGIRESSQREMSNQHSQDAQQTDHSQPPVVVNQQHDCAFFNTFPQEVRDNIYRHLLTQDDIVEAHALDEYRSTAIILSLGRPRSNLDATILRCCQRMYHEALPILYGENRFLFRTVVAICSFSVPDVTFTASLETPAVFNSTLHPKFKTRNRLRMIRHLVLQLSAIPYIHPDALFPPGFIPQPTRQEILGQWRSFLHPNPLTQHDDPLDFPALQDLQLDFSQLELLENEGIIVPLFIRKFRRGAGLDKLEIKGLGHEPSLELFKKGLVRDGGIFKKLE